MKKLSRIQFLKKVGLLGAGAMAGGAVLSACGESTPGTAPGMKNPESMVRKDTAVIDDECAELNKDLTNGDLATREAMNYVSQSEKEGKFCSGCMYWQPDKFEGSCGGCLLFVNGAVNPNGWCKSWQKPANS